MPVLASLPLMLYQNLMKLKSFWTMNPTSSNTYSLILTTEGTVMVAMFWLLWSSTVFKRWDFCGACLFIFQSSLEPIHTGQAIVPPQLFQVSAMKRNVVCWKLLSHRYDNSRPTQDVNELKLFVLKSPESPFRLWAASKARGFFRRNGFKLLSNTPSESRHSIMIFQHLYPMERTSHSVESSGSIANSNRRNRQRRRRPHKTSKPNLGPPMPV